MPKSKKSYILYGLFGLVVLFVAYWGFNFLKGSSIFNKNYTYYIYYKRIDGLNTSSPVTVNGFKIGQVVDIEFLPKQELPLKVTIDVTNKILLPDSTLAIINSMDLLGSKGIELIFDNYATSFHKSGDVLNGEIEQSLKDQVSVQMLPIKNQAEQLMKELSNAIEIITYIFNEETRSNIEKSIASIKNTVANIEHMTYGVDTLMASEIKKIDAIISNVEAITATLRNNNDNINRMISNLTDFSDTLKAMDISKTIVEANMILVKVNDIIDKINRGEGTIGELINDDKLINDLEKTVNSLDKLFNDVRINPKKYVSFSLLKIGRTVNVGSEDDLSPRDKKALEKQRRKNLEKEEKSNKKKNNSSDDSSLLYMIQIKSSTTPINYNSPEFKDYSEITEKIVNGKYKYFLFPHSDPTQTKYYNDILKEDFPDAFPVAFIGDEQMPYTDAVELYLVNNLE